MDTSSWLSWIYLAAAVMLLMALGDATLALLSRVRGALYERRAHRYALETFQVQLETARIQRVDRERESHSWNGYRKFRVARRHDEGGDICSFYLEPHDAKSIPSYRPGQYLTFSMKIPDQARPVVRCYSLSDSPHPEHFRVSVKRIGSPPDHPDAPPGRSSSYFHDHVQVGDILDVKAPVGDFSLDLSKSKPVVLVGGGVGVTPVLAMLNAIATRGFDREVWFFYGVRDSTEQILRQHFRALALGHPEKLHLHVCQSQVAETALIDDLPVRHHAEHVSVDLFKRVLPSSNFDYYICGPPAMMDALTHGLREWNVPDHRVHFESFGPATLKRTPRARATGAATASGIKVKFAKSDRELTWDPEATCLLEFAEQNGIAIDSGCRAGSCGTCVTAIRSGEIDYLSEPGDPPEAGSCLTCIAVPRTDVLLDA